MANEVTLTAQNFETEVLKSELPVLVDFWAEWCMPCRMLAPTLEEFSKIYNGKLKIAKLNVDDEPDVASQYGIVSIPTLILFHKGQPVAQHIGLAPRQTLENLLKPYVS
ncbi:MAG: thioredoxin [Spirochaetes bacterium]|nr:thioredoxin [Spirochaetota bacterium]